MFDYISVNKMLLRPGDQFFSIILNLPSSRAQCTCNPAIVGQLELRFINW